MADSKKYNGSTWEHSLRKLTTSTDTITTLPADLYADGNNATVGLVGNMSQSGTPTPTTPIQPQECGDLETTGAHAGQYKIPISSASTTTPVYLGQVQTTRKIKKLVLTGDENAYVYANADIAFRINTSDAMLNNRYCVCTHFVYQRTPGGSKIDGVTAGAGDYNLYFTFSASSATQFGVVAGDTYSFTSYLTAQYAAGTPVCVWYVLATPTTGIVNEPIRKIGDYADTVSGITIPTISGKDSFDVLTTLKPSEVSLSYTGWHDATVKEWDGSEWQDEQPVSLLSASSRPTLTESTPDITDITEPEEEKE